MIRDWVPEHLNNHIKYSAYFGFTWPMIWDPVYESPLDFLLGYRHVIAGYENPLDFLLGYRPVISRPFLKLRNIYSETGDITKSFTNVCSRMYSLTFLIIVFAFVHGKMWWMRPLTWHQEASSGSSKGTVSNWLNRLLPHLPIPCFQLEAGCIDPIDLAEQGFSPTFLLDHGHFGNLMKDTEPLGGRGCWGTHRQVMWD